MRASTDEQRRRPGRPPIEPTSESDYDRILERLYQNRVLWRDLEYSKRVTYVEAMRSSLSRIGPEWVRLSCQAKGVVSGLFGEGEEWLLGPMIVARALRTIETAISARFHPCVGRVRCRIDGRSIVPVFPNGYLENGMWLGMSGETWVRGRLSQGREYLATLKREPEVCLVLGAGNVSSIPATDLLTKLFLENRPVLLKMNPVNEYLGPVLEELLYPLVRDGFVGIIYGGVEVAQRAVEDERIGTVHLTGSDATYQAIKAATEKPVTAELGCVSPVVLVPGKWGRLEMRYLARHIASMKAFNAGNNCVSPQVLITYRGWPQRELFLEKLNRAFECLPQRPNYYPGSAERHKELLEHYPQALRCGIWSQVLDVPNEVEQPCFQQEAFCGFLAETQLDAPSVDEYLEKATEFCNQRLWGDLSCTVFANQKSQREHERAFLKMVTDLRYGTVGVNLWPGVGFGLMNTPWGPYQGEGAQSGVGKVHNTAMLDNVEKTVLRGPFTTPYVPPWFVDHPRAAEMGKRLTAFESEPSLKGLLSVHRSILKAGAAVPQMARARTR